MDYLRGGEDCRS